MKKIVFVGNCQGRWLHNIFQEEFAYVDEFQSDFIASFLDLDDTDRAKLREADIVVAQIYDSPHPVEIDATELRARVISYPNIAGKFLWPYAGAPHIWRERLPEFWNGAYGGWFGDRWLNRKLQAGVPRADIVAEYLEHDVAKAANLDRLYAIHADFARKRDAKTGFGLALDIERNLRDECLFANAGTPSIRMFRRLAEGVFERLGVPGKEVERALGQFCSQPFHLEFAPVHP